MRSVCARWIRSPRRAQRLARMRLRMGRHVRDDAFTCAHILCTLTSTPDLDRHTAVGRELTLLHFDAGSEFIQTESAGRQQILESPDSIEDFTLVHQHVSTPAMGIQEATAFLKQLAQKRGPDAIPHQRPALPQILLQSTHLWQLRE